MKKPNFVTISEGGFRRLGVHDQKLVANEAWSKFPDITGDRSTEDKRWKIVQEAQARASGGERSGRLKGGISASEVNDWLQTLPPFQIAEGG
jgi:hypothetical protein